MSKYEISFNKPSITGKELRYIKESIKTQHISGDGVFTKKCNAYLEKAIGIPKVQLSMLLC